MSFKPFSETVQRRFNELSQGELFVVQAENIFARYLAAFPPGTNEMFRKRTEYDCKCCENFVKRLGIVVGIKDAKVITLWGDHDLPHPYKVVSDALHAYVSSLPIESVFRTKERQYGAEFNYDEARNRYEHFVGKVGPKHYKPNADTERGAKAATYQVCQRGLKEIRLQDLDTVLSLIAENGLYRGEQFKPAIIGFRELLQGYVASGKSDLFIWQSLNSPFAEFRNTAIGTLFTDLAEGKELDAAVNSYEAKVSANTYKRPTPVITQNMLESAVQTLNDLKLLSAIQRRYARISDISANDVLFVHNDLASQMKDSVTKILESSVVKSTPDLSHALPVTAEHFLMALLPGAKSVEVLVENRHCGNFVSLTGADGPELPFKWDNNFAWSYEGNTTDSVKQRVKAAGGNINADLRISLSWKNFDDLDLHAQCPHGHVHWQNPGMPRILDVDMNAGSGRTRTPVENLAFLAPRDGVYSIRVDQFSRRETIDWGFEIEIECKGILRKFSHTKAMPDREYVPCFEFTMKGGQVTNFTSTLAEGTASQDKWGIKTETLVPVTVIAYSPNHWGGNAVGAKHLIFGLRGCRNPKPTRGIYNEYLRSDLEKHRKVFEVLGAKTECAPTDDQVSGIGFTAARGDSVTVVVDGRRSYIVSF
jgi:hypothetical protein